MEGSGMEKGGDGQHMRAAQGQTDPGHRAMVMGGGAQVWKVSVTGGQSGQNCLVASQEQAGVLPQESLLLMFPSGCTLPLCPSGS